MGASESPELAVAVIRIKPLGLVVKHDDPIGVIDHVLRLMRTCHYGEHSIRTARPQRVSCGPETIANPAF